jgi:lysyl-tRNA synthetase, class II
LINEESAQRVIVQSKVISRLRQYLASRDFMEVQTPTLWNHQGGATATPFETSSVAFGSTSSLYLRIAPELFLKQLVIGGFDRVFEIGKVFRNEGVDATHHPEFTICEFYQGMCVCVCVWLLMHD